MALLSIKTSKKIEITVRVEETTAHHVAQYAAFAKVAPDDVVNSALEYIFAKDIDFRKHLADNPDAVVSSALRIKKPASSAPRTSKRPSTSPR